MPNVIKSKIIWSSFFDSYLTSTFLAISILKTVKLETCTRNAKKYLNFCAEHVIKALVCLGCPLPDKPKSQNGIARWSFLWRPTQVWVLSRTGLAETLAKCWLPSDKIMPNWASSCHLSLDLIFLSLGLSAPSCVCVVVLWFFANPTMLRALT